MIAEVVTAFRWFSRPFRREFWLPPSNESTDRPGVVLVSLDELKEWERRLLGRVLPHYRFQSLSDQALPRDHIDEHLESETLWTSSYRILVLISRTWLGLWRLLCGRTSLAQHLCESDDIARLHVRLLSGKCFAHIGSLHSDRVNTIKRLNSFLRGLEHRRYELWVIARAQKLAVLPVDLPLPDEPLKIAEVVEMARRRPLFEPKKNLLTKEPKPAGVLRIMSYNIHSAIGLDGRHSLRRIAEVLHHYEPDFVALQELDAGCRRTAQQHQLKELAKLWSSEGEFLPLVKMRGGEYGIGFLSKLPILNYQSKLLPAVDQVLPQEARGVQQITIGMPDGSRIDIFNTHLGLTAKQRRAQLKELLKFEFSGTQILTGDFNCPPKSKEYRLISRSWKPTQPMPAKTWFGTFPIRHLDYCFFRGRLEVAQTLVPRNSLTRLASDHLPLITDFKLANE